MSTDPFSATPEQVAEVAASDTRLASLARREAALLSTRPALDAAVDAAQERLRQYEREVVEPAERALRAALVGMRPFVGNVRRAKSSITKLHRKRLRLWSAKAARLSKIKEMIARTNLIASQKELIAQFRGRRRRRNLFKPEFQTCKSNDTPTAATTATTGLPTAPSSSA